MRQLCLFINILFLFIPGEKTEKSLFFADMGRIFPLCMEIIYLHGVGRPAGVWYILAVQAG